MPQRYLPEKLGSPMLVTRFGYNDGIDEDVFTVRSRDERPDRTKVAVYANGLYMKDSLIGHSTVLNVRSTDKSLLLNPNWNPFVAQTPFVQATVWQAGGDAVVRAPLGSYAMTAEAEINYGKFSNTYGTVILKGGRVHFGVAKGAWDASVRHAVLYPDARMANTYTLAGSSTPLHSNLFADDKPMREFTPSLTYHYRSNVALVGDLPILVNTDGLVEADPDCGGRKRSVTPDRSRASSTWSSTSPNSHPTASSSTTSVARASHPTSGPGQSTPTTSARVTYVLDARPRSSPPLFARSILSSNARALLAQVRLEVLRRTRTASEHGAEETAASAVR